MEHSPLQKSRGTSKDRQNAFSRLKTLSSSFSKTRCSHNRNVAFDFEETKIDYLPDDVDRSHMFMSYKDKVTAADNVEETCYQFNDSDYVHPYVLHLMQVWDQCGKIDKVDSARALPMDADSLHSLVQAKSRGLEKKLHPDMKKYRDTTMKQILDTQKNFKHLPATAKAKMIRNKSKKATLQAKVFALTVAQGDAIEAEKVYGKTFGDHAVSA
jgi:hypothetical protein